ncbi:MAG: nitrite reductase small subunit NirD [Mycobacteriales bacterium]
MSWHPVCPFVRLPLERAVCVLVGGEQVALVRTRDDSLYAVGNLDPVSGAMVMSRGIVGSRGERDVLASPMHKQVYDLATGECLDRPGVWLDVHEVRVVDGDVEIALAEEVRRLA